MQNLHIIFYNSIFIPNFVSRFQYRIVGYPTRIVYVFIQRFCWQNLLNHKTMAKYKNNEIGNVEQGSASVSCVSSVVTGSGITKECYTPGCWGPDRDLMIATYGSFSKNNMSVEEAFVFAGRALVDHQRQVKNLLALQKGCMMDMYCMTEEEAEMFLARRAQANAQVVPSQKEQHGEAAQFVPAPAPQVAGQQFCLWGVFRHSLFSFYCYVKQNKDELTTVVQIVVQVVLH